MFIFGALLSGSRVVSRRKKEEDDNDDTFKCKDIMSCEKTQKGLRKFNLHVTEINMTSTSKSYLASLSQTVVSRDK